MSERVNSILAIARECLGTPFVHQGRDSVKGIDCAGHLAHIFKRKNLNYNERKAYPRIPFGGAIEKNLDSQPHLKRIHRSELSPGDVIVFRIETSPQHIGIYTGKNIIHACSTVKRVVEVPFKPWKPQLKLVYRIVE